MFRNEKKRKGQVKTTIDKVDHFQKRTTGSLCVGISKMYVNIVRRSPHKGFLDRNPARRIVPCLNGLGARNERFCSVLEFYLRRGEYSP